MWFPEILCHEPDSNITLHAADLNIQNDTVTVVEAEAREQLEVVAVSYDKDREFFIIYTGAELRRGARYRVRIEYTAHLKDNLKGFYRSVYTDPVTNTTEYVAVTQFQATDARRAFPCFDEPGVKAAYEVWCEYTFSFHIISDIHFVR